MFKQEYLTNLVSIIDLIKKDENSEAILKFREYLEKLEMGEYASAEWDKKWRARVYEFGRIFEEKNAAQFISVINEFLNKGDSQKNEAIQFIRSEIVWNYFTSDKTYAADILRGLIKKYPCNPEFHHSYSHFLENKENHSLSVEESFLAFKIESDNQTFYENAFNKCKNYFDRLLLKGKTEDAEKIIGKMREIVKLRKDIAFNNTIVVLKDRLADHIIINKRIKEIPEIAQKIVDKSQGKLIEIMGFLVAILGFAFISINLAISHLNFNEILLIMLGMGLILSFFATLISILFHANKILYKDSRVWFLVILIVLFIIFICKYQS